MTFMHLQLIIGLILYFISPKVIFSGSSMSDPILRFFLVEHISLMLIAVVLITVGYVKTKKIEGVKKYRTILIYYVISLLLILASIPWPFRDLGGKWF
jgi:membrane protein DedA with SNARE-associated domain